MARLLSINVGLPRDIAWRERTVHTGVWKDPVQGRRKYLLSEAFADPPAYGTQQHMVPLAE
jgi:hypothetical protein